MKQVVRAIVVQNDQVLVMHRNKFGHKYYTLIGGGVYIGESLEQALIREVKEESGLRVVQSRLVFIEEAGAMYGTQHIYLCTVEGEGVQLSPDTEEAKINSLGQNIYTPMWVPFAGFEQLPFRTPLLQQAILLGVAHGFPAEPVMLKDEFIAQVQSNISK
jgi:ADP-ribose pyrophosphatase YjhB (NUDIX family)